MGQMKEYLNALSWIILEQVASILSECINQPFPPLAAGGPSSETLQPPPHTQGASEGVAFQEQTQTAASQRKDAQRSEEAHSDQRAPWEEGEQKATLH